MRIFNFSQLPVTHMHVLLRPLHQSTQNNKHFMKIFTLFVRSRISRTARNQRAIFIHLLLKQAFCNIFS